MKEKTKKILVILVKLRHHANRLFGPNSVGGMFYPGFLWGNLIKVGGIN